MKYKSVSTIAAILCGILLFFAASLTAFAQNGVRTAELELNPPADAVDAFTATGGGIFHFSFATGKTEWVPFRKPANIQELAELAMRERNPEKGPAGLDFSFRGEIDMRKAPIMILSEDEIKSILSSGNLPEKKATTKPQHMSPDSWYILKDEANLSFYVFRLKDHSPGYVWQQIAYVRIGEGESWKGNPDLAALLDVPKADTASNSRRKTNADKTRQKIQQAWDKQEAERKIAAEQARQDALDKRIEDVKQQSDGDTFPKTPEEIKLVEDLIGQAEYGELIKLCEGKKLDFNVKGKNDISLLYLAIDKDPIRRLPSVLDRRNKIFEFILNHGGSALLPTEDGVLCVSTAAITNNKVVFDLLLKNGFDINQKGPMGKTALELVIMSRGTIEPEIMNKLMEGTAEQSLFAMVSRGDVAGLKKALEDKDNLANINKPESDGKTLLEHAIKLEPDQNSNLEIVRTLLASGAEFGTRMIEKIILNQKNDLLPVMWEFYDRLSEDDWNQCFDQAVSYKNSDAFRFFLEQGLDPEKKLSSGRSPLTSACRAGTKEMVDLLVARGFKISFGVAVRSNDLDLVKEYLASGVDVNADDDAANGKPISLAVFENHLEMAELLIEHGANVSPDYYRREGKSYPVRTSATLRNHAKMTELLLRHGFVPDFPDPPGDTKNADKSSALYMALSCGEYETAKVLLKYGARTDVTVQRRAHDSKQKETVLIDVGLEEVFKNNPKALEVLRSGKNFFDFR